MRKLTLALLALGSCSYTDPNPWDTSNDVAALEEKTRQDWLLELREPYDFPQEPDVAFLDSDVELWSVTVLPAADGDSLRRYHRWSVETIKALEGEERRLLYLGTQPRRAPLIRIRHRLAGERERLRLVEERIPRAAE